MSITIAINGYGRIGRNIVRAIYENDLNSSVRIAAINDLGDIAINAHLTKYDTTHGRFNADVKTEGEYLIINGDRILVTSERDPANLPWKQLGIDVVYECTGFFTKRQAAEAHLKAGAKKVLISAPAEGADATIVYGVNHHTLKATDTVVSNASCTTNCLAPLAKPLHEKIGIVSGLMNTVHAYTNDQSLLDSYHPDLRRARAAAESIIPSKTGAAAALGLVLPELSGKLDGFALRVPTVNVSIVDLTFKAARPTSVEEVNEILTHAANHDLKNILVVNHEPLVSIDFNHNPASSVFDATQTKVMGDLVKVLSWYDNEWGFSNRMIDTSRAMMASK
jgi:glyceraldehyde 3-phosphate dehydrogenase